MLSCLFHVAVISANEDYCIYQAEVSACPTTFPDDKKLSIDQFSTYFKTHAQMSAVIVGFDTYENSLAIPEAIQTSFEYLHLAGTDATKNQYVSFPSGSYEALLDLENIEVVAVDQGQNLFECLSLILKHCSISNFYLDANFLKTDFYSMTNLYSTFIGSIKNKLEFVDVPTNFQDLNFPGTIFESTEVIIPKDFVFDNVKLSDKGIASLIIADKTLEFRLPWTSSISVHVKSISYLAMTPNTLEFELQESQKYIHCYKDYFYYNGDFENLAIDGNMAQLIVNMGLESTETLPGPKAISVTSNADTFQFTFLMNPNDDPRTFGASFQLSKSDVSKDPYIIIKADTEVDISTNYDKNQFQFVDFTTTDLLLKKLEPAILQAAYPYIQGTYNDLTAISVQDGHSLKLTLDSRGDPLILSTPCLIESGRFTPSYPIKISISENTKIDDTGKLAIRFRKGDGTLIASGFDKIDQKDQQKISVDWPTGTECYLFNADQTKAFPNFILKQNSGAVITPVLYHSAYCTCGEDPAPNDDCLQSCSFPEITTVDQILPATSFSELFPTLLKRGQPLTVFVGDLRVPLLTADKLSTSLVFYSRKQADPDSKCKVDLTLTNPTKDASVSAANLKLRLASGENAVLGKFGLKECDLTIDNDIEVSTLRTDLASIQKLEKTITFSILELTGERKTDSTNPSMIKPKSENSIVTVYDPQFPIHVKEDSVLFDNVFDLPTKNSISIDITRRNPLIIVDLTISVPATPPSMAGASIVSRISGISENSGISYAETMNADQSSVETEPFKIPVKIRNTLEECGAMIDLQAGVFAVEIEGKFTAITLLNAIIHSSSLDQSLEMLTAFNGSTNIICDQIISTETKIVYVQKGITLTTNSKTYNFIDAKYHDYGFTFQDAEKVEVDTSDLGYISPMVTLNFLDFKPISGNLQNGKKVNVVIATKAGQDMFPVVKINHPITLPIVVTGTNDKKYDLDLLKTNHYQNFDLQIKDAESAGTKFCDYCVVAVLPNDQNECAKAGFVDFLILSYHDVDARIKAIDNTSTINLAIAESAADSLPKLVQFRDKNIHLYSLKNFQNPENPEKTENSEKTKNSENAQRQNVNMVFDDGETARTILNLEDVIVRPLFSLQSPSVDELTTMPFSSVVMRNSEFDTVDLDKWYYKMQTQQMDTDLYSISSDVIMKGGNDVANFILNDNSLSTLAITVTPNFLALSNQLPQNQFPHNHFSENDENEQNNENGENDEKLYALIYVHKTATIKVKKGALVGLMREKSDSLRYLLALEIDEFAEIRFDESWLPTKLTDKAKVLIKGNGHVALRAQSLSHIPWISAAEGVQVDYIEDPKPTTLPSTATKSGGSKGSRLTLYLSIAFGGLVFVLAIVVIALAVTRKRKQNKIISDTAGMSLIQGA